MLRPSTHLGLMIVATLAVGCTPSRGGEAGAPLEGYGSLKFGDSFSLSLGAAGPAMFNPYSITKCVKFLATRGCLLNREDDLTVFETKGGIPYSLSLSFNRFDKLTDISLDFVREGGVSAQECQSIHERTMDWLTKDYGPFDATLTLDEGDESGKTEQRRTPSGSVYKFWKSGRNSEDFIAESIRRMPNGRSIFVLSSMITVSEVLYCRVLVSFADAQSIERWEIDPDTLAITGSSEQGGE